MVVYQLILAQGPLTPQTAQPGLVKQSTTSSVLGELGHTYEENLTALENMFELRQSLMNLGPCGRCVNTLEMCGGLLRPRCVQLAQYSTWHRALRAAEFMLLRDRMKQTAVLKQTPQPGAQG